MIPIMKPLLPSADAILPYLRRIDESRWYSNYGPLNEEYEDRLAKRYNCHVVTCASATVGITACLMALLPGKDATVGVPSWTFAASINAIYAAGHAPAMLDVYKDNIVDMSSGDGCDAYVIVAPFGKHVQVEPTEKPAVIDAASGFDSFTQIPIGDTPVVISTHCTKVFGTGEGGFILSKDKQLIDRLRMILNQGMRADKSVAELGLNGKLSEYHAAVGLAELDGWEEKRKAWMYVQTLYGNENTGYVTSTQSELLSVPAAPIVEKLAAKGIQARVSWYGTAHRQVPFMENAAGQCKMTRTDYLADHTIFLPKHIGMTQDDVLKVKTSLMECLYT